MPLTFDRIQGNVVHVRATGALSDEDYKDTFVPTMEELFTTWTGVRMLFAMDQGFEGWNPHGAWEELRFERKHRNDMIRVAVVGDKRWERWATRFSKIFTGANARFFTPDDADAARAWITSGVD